MTLVLFVLLATGAQEPPERYNVPIENLRVIEKSSAQVHQTCSNFSGYRGDARVLACAIPLSNGCMIIWPEHRQKTGVLWRHEKAHCAGWPGHHPS